MDPFSRHSPHTGRDDSPAGDFVRVREGGEIVQRIELDRAGFACALGGPDGTTLFMLAAEWNGIENVDDAIARRTGQVLTICGTRPRRRMAMTAPVALVIR